MIPKRSKLLKLTQEEIENLKSMELSIINLQ
jgi:hypothetical protein